MSQDLRISGISSLVADAKRFNQPVSIVAEVVVFPDGTVHIRRLRWRSPIYEKVGKR